MAWGALVRRLSGSYEIGQRIWELGLLAPVPAGFRQLAAPFLQDLYKATFATVHFAVREGTKALYLDRLSGNDSIPLVSRVGGRLPLHATGVGKVLLAYAPEDVQVRVLANLTRATRYTITDPDALEDELRAVRRDGFAQTREERSLGACSLAVPVRDRDGGVVAALGLIVASLEPDRARPRSVIWRTCYVADAFPSGNGPERAAWPVEMGPAGNVLDPHLGILEAVDDLVRASGSSSPPSPAPAPAPTPSGASPSGTTSRSARGSRRRGGGMEPSSGWWFRPDLACRR